MFTSVTCSESQFTCTLFKDSSEAILIPCCLTPDLMYTHTMLFAVQIAHCISIDNINLVVIFDP